MIFPPDGLTHDQLREAASQELRQRWRLVEQALMEKTPGEYVDVRAMFEDRAVVCKGARHYAWPYTIGEDNAVVLGEPQEVLEQYIPVRNAEAAAGSFLEAADAEGTAWDVVVIRAGLSHNGNYYPDAALRDAVPLFEGARVFAKSDAEHVEGAGKDVRQLIGWLAAPRYVEGRAPDTGYIAARLNLSKAETRLRELLVDAWRRGKRDLAGLSIDAKGRAKPASVREGRKVRQLIAFSKVDSVDLIVEPAAGGALVELVEAVEDSTGATMQATQDAPAAGAVVIDQAAIDARIAEAVNAATAQAIAAANARLALIGKVAAAPLPQVARERIAAELNALKSFTEADVDAAIARERDYLAQFCESGKVQMPEFGDAARVTEAHADKVAKQIAALFDPKDCSSISLKEAYVNATGDRRVTGRIEDCDARLLRELSGAVGMREAINTAGFANVLGTSLTRRMIEAYQVADMFDVWRRAARVVPVTDFRTQERVRYGGYGNLPAVNEGAAYLPLNSPTDEKATYAVTKRGGTEDVTLEAVRNDDVGMILELPMKLAMSAKRTLSEFVLDFIRTNPAIYDGDALYHANHANLGTTALSLAEFGVHRLLMLKQTEKNSGKRLGLAPANLWVPFDLAEAATNLFTQGTENEEKFLSRIRPTVIEVWYWTDVTDWATSASIDQCPFIEVGFLDGREEPELFVQDLPNAGSLFSNDKWTYKMRHIYGGAVKDFRGTTKAVVAG